MNSKKGFILLTGGIFFLIGASASATVVADEVNSKDKAPVVAEVNQHAKAPLIAGVPPMPTLADIWDKNQCFVVLSGHCL